MFNDFLQTLKDMLHKLKALIVNLIAEEIIQIKIGDGKMSFFIDFKRLKAYFYSTPDYAPAM